MKLKDARMPNEEKLINKRGQLKEIKLKERKKKNKDVDETTKTEQCLM